MYRGEEGGGRREGVEEGRERKEEGGRSSVWVWGLGGRGMCCVCMFLQ